MGSSCDRMGCSTPATVVFGADPLRMIVVMQAVDPSTLGNLRPGILCKEHADRLTVPRGWTLDDRREPTPRLFRMPTPPEPAARRPGPDAGTAPPPTTVARPADPLFEQASLDDVDGTESASPVEPTRPVPEPVPEPVPVPAAVPAAVSDRPADPPSDPPIAHPGGLGTSALDSPALEWDERDVEVPSLDDWSDGFLAESDDMADDPPMAEVVVHELEYVRDIDALDITVDDTGDVMLDDVMPDDTDDGSGRPR